jgi:hypothetical protein
MSMSHEDIGETMAMDMIERLNEEHDKVLSENVRLMEEGKKLDRDLTDMIWDPLFAQRFIMREPFAPITDHLKILTDDYQRKIKEIDELKKETRDLEELEMEKDGLWEFIKDKFKDDSGIEDEVRGFIWG